LDLEKYLVRLEIGESCLFPYATATRQPACGLLSRPLFPADTNWLYISQITFCKHFFCCKLRQEHWRGTVDRPYSTHQESSHSKSPWVSLIQEPLRALIHQNRCISPGNCSESIGLSSRIQPSSRRDGLEPFSFETGTASQEDFTQIKHWIPCK